MTIIQRADLACREGSKDAVYHIQINERDGGYTVDFEYGRRGGTTQKGTKTKAPVTLEAAKKAFDKVVKEKMTDSPPYKLMRGDGNQQAQSQQMSEITSSMAERSTGLVPQLLKSIEESSLPNMIHGNHYVAQQKFDGERRFIQSSPGDAGGDPKVFNKVIAANRKGLEIAIDSDIKTSLNGIVCTLDGEQIGSKLYAFDLISWNGVDFKDRSYSERKIHLDSLASRFGPSIIVVKDAFGSDEKRALIQQVKDLGQEGVVFKDLHAPYGEPQLKFKLIEDATVRVLKHKEDKRSIEMGVMNTDQPEVGFISIGFVTIPPNHAIPVVGELVDVQYLYAYEGGSLFQPVYKGPRTDLELTAANFFQLKYKADHVEVQSQDEVETLNSAPRQR